MLDDFLRRITRIKEDIDKLRAYTSKFSELQGKKLRDVLEPQEEREISGQIEAVAELFRKQSRHIKTELEGISLENSRTKNECGEESLEYQSRNLHWQRCTKHLTMEINMFRQEQVKYAQNEKEKLRSQYMVINPKATNEEVAELLANENSDAILQEALAGGSESSRRQLEEAKDRNKKIRSLTKRLDELLELINDLQKMVNRSGCVVDKIDVKMSKTKASTEAANRDLEVAYRYQMRAMWIKRIIYGVVALVLVLVAIYIFFTLLPTIIAARQGGGRSNNRNQ